MARASPTKRASPWFGPRLREVREGLGLTQAIVAERMGIDERSYRRYETGERRPSVDTIIDLLETLPVDARVLFARPRSTRSRRPGRPAGRRTVPMTTEEALERKASEIADEAVKGYEKILSPNVIAEIRRLLITDLLATDEGRAKLLACLDPSERGS